MANPLSSAGHVNTIVASAASRTRSNSAFIPELWTDEIVARYKANLVMAPNVVNMPFGGRRGDTVHVPAPTRGDPSAKVTEEKVTLIKNQEAQKQYLIDQHWEYSRLIEDIAALQAEDTLRQFYTDDAGYALAKLVDTNLHTVAGRLAAGAASAGDRYTEGTYLQHAVYGAPTAGALVNWPGTSSTQVGTALTDEGIRLMIQRLDDLDVPGQGRVLVVPPVEKKNLLGLARFTEQAFVGEGSSIRTGKIGDVYGVEVYVSTNCGTAITDHATSPTTAGRVALLFQKEALLFIEQMAPRTQSSYNQEYLGDLFTADLIFGRGVLRPEAGLAIIVPN